MSSGCLQLNGTESTGRPEECGFTDIDSKNSGLYWCQGPDIDQKSNSVNITVSCKNTIDKKSTVEKSIHFPNNTRVMCFISLSSDGEVHLLSPVLPVMKGDSVTLQCNVKLYEFNQIIFYKNGVKVLSQRGTQMTIENVTQADEGFYKCAIANSTLESLENRLSVRGARS